MGLKRRELRHKRVMAPHRRQGRFRPSQETTMGRHVRVAGVGMIPFTKPGQSEDWDVMAEKAIRMALEDAGIGYELIQQAYAGYVYGDSTAGQSALYRVGITGIPIVNVYSHLS